MDYGAHLPLMALDGRPWTLERLLQYAQTAEGAGFQALSANEHLVFGRPWLDGLTGWPRCFLAPDGWPWPPRWPCR